MILLSNVLIIGGLTKNMSQEKIPVEKFFEMQRKKNRIVVFGVNILSFLIFVGGGYAIDMFILKEGKVFTIIGVVVSFIVSQIIIIRILKKNILDR